MRIPHLAVVGFLALTACDSDATFDASSEGAYLKSLGEITAKLNDQEQRRLQVALLTLAFGNTVQSNGLQYAKPEFLQKLVTLNGTPNPLQYLDRVRPIINGRSASAVIRQVAADLDNEISREEASAAGAYKLLGEVSVDHPRYYWDKRRNLPVIECSIYNGSKSVISRVHLSGTLTAPGHPEKWATSALSYRFDRGLAPGVQTPLTLMIGALSTRTGQQLEKLYDADITLKVSNIEDANGQRLIRIDTDILEGMRRKRDFLRGG